jgi:hypothetical protein
MIQRADEKLSADLGVNLLRDDRICLEKDSKLVIVSYEDCTEWAAAGEDTLTFKAGNAPVSEKQKILASRKLPVCYKPEAFQGEIPQKIGGIPLMGVEADPADSLRDELKGGNASNSTLMTLMMHDLKEGDIESAKTCFDILKTRLPASEFLKQISARFEK